MPRCPIHALLWREHPPTLPDEVGISAGTRLAWPGHRVSILMNWFPLKQPQAASGHSTGWHRPSSHCASFWRILNTLSPPLSTLLSEVTTAFHSRVFSGFQAEHRLPFAGLCTLFATPRAFYSRSDGGDLAAQHPLGHFHPPCANLSTRRCLLYNSCSCCWFAPFPTSVPLPWGRHGF